MVERPILFSGPMVRAILDGHKTMTRRVMKTQPTSPATIFDVAGGLPVWAIWPSEELDDAGHPKDHGIKCPYGRPGDRLWVRETWCGYEGTRRGYFKADMAYWDHITNKPFNCPGEPENCRWRSPIYMPRWASRITLEIIAVRVERLQAISEADAVAEGIESKGTGSDGKPRWNVCGLERFGQVTSSPIWAFERLWDKRNGKSHPWQSNPWVWVVEFRKAVSRG